jgi:hypothetical protein
VIGVRARYVPAGIAAYKRRGTNWQFVLQVFDGDGFDGGGEVEVEDFGVEVEFGVEGAFDVVGLAEAVLFAFKGEVGGREFVGADGLEHGFGLAGGNDGVF